jgi:dTDP-4-dehydrorhamnose reductase
MLGHKMFQVLSKDHDTFATVRSHNGSWRKYPVYEDVDPVRVLADIDAHDISSVAYAISSVKPDVVVNCIGVIKQVEKHREPLTSIATNALFPHRLAELCPRLIHISTDCVFSGNKGNYTEDDPPDATDLYGRTKILGEVIRPNTLTIRTSIIGRDFSKRTALLEWFLGNDGGKVKGYTNAIFSGLPTQVLAQILSEVIETDLAGLYHISSKPISKFDLLCLISDAFGAKVEIEPYHNFYCDRSLNSDKFWNEADIFAGQSSWDNLVHDLILDDTPYDEWWVR